MRANVKVSCDINTEVLSSCFQSLKCCLNLLYMLLASQSMNIEMPMEKNQEPELKSFSSVPWQQKIIKNFSFFIFLFFDLSKWFLLSLYSPV